MPTLTATLIFRHIEMRWPVLLLSLVFFCLAAGKGVTPPEVCGRWVATCVPLANGLFMNAAWEFNGISVGSYAHSMYMFTNDTCADASAYLEVRSPA